MPFVEWEAVDFFSLFSFDFSEKHTAWQESLKVVDDADAGCHPVLSDIRPL
jgi:hypothetical protein